MHILDLTIEDSENPDTYLRLRLAMRIVKEGGVDMEVWTSPDFPMPEQAIAGIVGFLEDFVGPVGGGQGFPGIHKATIPASLVRRLMGPGWRKKLVEITDEQRLGTIGGPVPGTAGPLLGLDEAERGGPDSVDQPAGDSDTRQE